MRERYRGADTAELERQLAGARQARSWLAGLDIDPEVRATLVEPIAVVEEALAECERSRAATA